MSYEMSQTLHVGARRKTLSTPINMVNANCLTKLSTIVNRLRQSASMTACATLRDRKPPNVPHIFKEYFFPPEEAKQHRLTPYIQKGITG